MPSGGRCPAAAYWCAFSDWGDPAPGFIEADLVAHSGLEAEPWPTSCELFKRLQAEQPGAHSDRQLQTLQRRLKGWWREVAQRMVFGGDGGQRDDTG
jgi:hypothetical protein